MVPFTFLNAGNDRLRSDLSETVQIRKQRMKKIIKLNERYKIKVFKYKKTGKLKEKKIQGLWKNC